MPPHTSAGDYFEDGRQERGAAQCEDRNHAAPPVIFFEFFF